MDQSASIGILMLESQFPRILGDMGNADTWSFPVVYRVVRNASPDQVVRQRAEGLLPAFIAAAQELEAEGVAGITTTCGFLCTFQDALANAVSVPVLTSSLMQVAGINAVLPRGRRAGVLTISRKSLSAEHLRAAGVPKGTPIGSPEGHFAEAILGDQPNLDVSQAEAENVAAAVKLVRDNPEIGAIVLECTNMSPYASAIQDITGLPVFSIVCFVDWFYEALSPKQWCTND